jgi:rubrerythrin
MNIILNKDYNLLSIYPDIVNLFWDWKKNNSNKIYPSLITPKSAQKAWWNCKKCGYKEFSSVQSKTRKGTKCLGCDGHRVTTKNNLLISRPDIMREWNYKKNKDIDPSRITQKSMFKVWWNCKKCDYVWKATVYSRYSGRGCPSCSGKWITTKNNIEKLFPKIAGEFLEKENKILVNKIMPGISNKKYLWRCNKCKGIHLSAPVVKVDAFKRDGGNACPYCGKYKKKVTDFNNFMVLHPSLADEWDYKKNKDLLPCRFTSGQNILVWWICSECDFSWKASIKCRVHGNSCPNCNKIVLRDGAICGSRIEAFYYLVLRHKKINFIHNKMYPKNSNLGRRRFDFYLNNLDIYIEVTTLGKNGRDYKIYKRNINKKKKYVIKNLKSKFIYINRLLSLNEEKFVLENMFLYNNIPNGHKITNHHLDTEFNKFMSVASQLTPDHIKKCVEEVDKLNGNNIHLNEDIMSDDVGGES